MNRLPEFFSGGLSDSALQAQARSLLRCNEITQRYGLALSKDQALTLAAHRVQALISTGRVEFGEGILKNLVTAFCDSPYLSQENYVQTLLALQDMFYHFKNESEGWLSDEELLGAMKWEFNNRAHGSLELLAGVSMEELCRGLRTGMWWSGGDWEEASDEE